MMPRSLVQAWSAWKRVAGWIAARQATLVYTVLYLVVLGPIALAQRPFRDPLRARAWAWPSFWTPRVGTPATLDAARRQ